MQKNPKKHLKNKKRWFFYSNSAPRLRNHQKYTKIFALNHDLLNFFLQVWYILDATWWILMCNLRLAFIQLPSSLQMRPLRLFKQVIWGDIWQLPLEWCTTKKARQDREHREDGQEKHDWHLLDFPGHFCRSAFAIVRCFSLDSYKSYDMCAGYI